MVEAAWRIVQPILDAWKQPPSDFPNYAAGSAGPSAADALLAMNGGHAWRALTPGRKPPPRRAPEARSSAATPIKKATKKTAKKAGKATPKRAAAPAAKSAQGAAGSPGKVAKTSVTKRATKKVAKAAAKTVSKAAAGKSAAKKSASKAAVRTPRS